MESTGLLDEAPQRKLSTNAKHKIIGWTLIGLAGAGGWTAGRAFSYGDQNRHSHPYKSDLLAAQKCKVDIASLSKTARLSSLSAKLLDDCNIYVPEESNGAKIEDATILLPNQAALNQTIATDEQAIRDASMNAPHVIAEVAVFALLSSIGVASIQMASGTGAFVTRR